MMVDFTIILNSLLEHGIPDSFSMLILCTNKLNWALNTEGIDQKLLVLDDALRNIPWKHFTLSDNLHFLYNDVRGVIAEINRQTEFAGCLEETIRHRENRPFANQTPEIYRKIAEYRSRYS